MIILAVSIVSFMIVLFAFAFVVGSPIGIVAGIVKGRKQYLCLRCKSVYRGNHHYRCPICYSQDITPIKSPAAQQAMSQCLTPTAQHMLICAKCGFNNVESARFCGHCGSPVATAAVPNPLVWTGVPYPPMFPNPRISLASWRFIAWGSTIAVGIFILLVIIGTLLPSLPNQSGASRPSAPQSSAPIQNDPAQTPKETEKDEQVKLGADAMLATWRVMPLAFNEQENLRFDAVVVMPNDTVCLWVHDANPVPGVIYPTAFFYYPRSKTLLSLSDVTFDLWMRECKNQEGVGVEPDIEADFNQIREKTYGLNQALHDLQQ